MRMLGSLVNTGRELARGLFQLIYPGVCGACGQALELNQAQFCGRCRAELTKERLPSCPRCGSTVGQFANIKDGCSRCRQTHYQFERVLRLGPYEGLLRDMVLRIKHESGDAVAELLGLLWGEHAGDDFREVEVDVIVPVPLHWWRRWKRGYNQSETLARALAAQLRLPCRASWLRRIRDTPHQTAQSPTGRWANVKGAFRARRAAALRGKTVLLVDDVLTTGSTCSEAARALKIAGAKRVVVAVLAHSQTP
jgi:ComF family protein